MHLYHVRGASTRTRFVNFRPYPRPRACVERPAYEIVVHLLRVPAEHRIVEIISDNASVQAIISDRSHKQLPQFVKYQVQTFPFCFFYGLPKPAFYQYGDLKYLTAVSMGVISSLRKTEKIFFGQSLKVICKGNYIHLFLLSISQTVFVILFGSLTDFF